MARGWESKDVESQVKTKEASKAQSGKGTKSNKELRRDQERRDLELSRTRILNDLEAATHPNHRKSLEAALTYLDKKIGELR